MLAEKEMIVVLPKIGTAKCTKLLNEFGEVSEQINLLKARREELRQQLMPLLQGAPANTAATKMFRVELSTVSKSLLDSKSIKATMSPIWLKRFTKTISVTEVSSTRLKAGVCYDGLRQSKA
jgi:hypothetical protein